jgi:lysophospholipase L1-like esterase
MLAVVALAAATLTLMLVEGVSRLGLSRLPEPESDVRFAFSDVWAHAKNPFHKPDRDLFWRLVPGYHGVVTINRQGFRTPPFSPKKAPGTYRIVVFGDSVTFGYKVTDRETYPRRLEQLLAAQMPAITNSDRRRIEVINVGVTGYTSWQGRVLYEKTVRHWAPDLVVIMFGYNDHHSAVQSDAEKYRRRYLASIANFFFKTGVYQLAVRLRERAIGPDLRRQPVPRVTVDEFQANLLAMRARAEADGARALFMTTAVRPGLPLVENFRAVDYTEGNRRRRVWLRQIDFAVRLLGPQRGLDVYRHFMDSHTSLEPFDRDADACHKVQTLSVSYPDFAIFSYLDASCAAARHDQETARAALTRAHAADGERRDLEAYNTRLRQMARTFHIDLIDLAQEFDQRGASLLSDVVHPTPAGHIVVAETLTDWIARLTSSRK